MRRNRAPDSVDVGNGMAEQLTAEDARDAVRMAGSYEGPLVIQDPEDALTVIELLVDFIKKCQE